MYERIYYSIVVKSGSGSQHTFHKIYRSLDDQSPQTSDHRTDHPLQPSLISRRNQIRSPFLRLPPEIRNKIYAYALSDYTVRFFHHSDSEHTDEKEDQEGTDSEDLPPPTSTPRQGQNDQNEEDLSSNHPLGLLNTCKQINHEARLFFYQLNEVQLDFRSCGKCHKIHDPNDIVADFLARLGKDQKAAIRHVGIHAISYLTIAYSLNLGGLGLNMRTINLYCDDALYGQPYTFLSISRFRQDCFYKIMNRTGEEVWAEGVTGKDVELEWKKRVGVDEEGNKMGEEENIMSEEEDEMSEDEFDEW